MKSSKVIKFLRSLNREEWNRFDRFVHSPYFNVHEETTRLWEILKGMYPDLSDDAVNKRNLFGQVFPGAAFQEVKLYNLSKYLLRLVEEFLILERRKLEDFQREYLTQFYVLDERKLHQYIPRLIKQGQQDLLTLRKADSDAALLEYQFSFLQMNYTLIQDNRSLETGISEVSKKLDQFFVLEKLRLAVPIANRNFILAQQAELDFVEEALSMFQHHQWQDYPLLQAHYLALLMFREPEETSHFTLFARYLGENAACMPRAESRSLYNYALNFCAIQSKRGDASFLEHMFALFEDMIQQDLMLSDPSTASPNFKNAVTLSLKLKKYSWTEQFILQKGPLLPESHRKIIMHYSLANLAFVQEKFSEAQKHLMEVDFLDPFYRLISDILLLKIYYEIEEADSLYFRCQALRKYLQRDKTLADANRKAYGNFVRIVHKMARLRFDRSGSKEGLQKWIEQLSPLVEQQWLKEKLRSFYDK